MGIINNVITLKYSVCRGTPSDHGARHGDKHKDEDGLLGRSSLWRGPWWQVGEA